LVAFTVPVILLGCERDGATEPPPTEWTFQPDKAELGSLAIGPKGDKVYLSAALSGRLFCISASSGEVNWSNKFSPALSLVPPVVDDDGTVYVIGPARTVNAVDGTSGDKRWSIRFNEKITPKLALGPNDRLIVATAESVYSINVSDGLVEWHTSIGRDAIAPSVGPNNTAFVTTSSPGGLIALSGKDGSQEWTYKINGPCAGEPAVTSNGKVFITAKAGGSVHAIEAQTGKALWTYDLGNYAVHDAPIVGPKGRVFVASENGEVHAIDGSTGSRVWLLKCETSSPYNTASAAGQKDTLYLCIGSSLWAVRRSDGTRLWQYRSANSALDPPALTPKKVILVKDGGAHALEVDDRLAQGRWPRQGFDNQNTKRVDN
jgi:outer membrane protein assembly factor BamB